PAATLLPAAAAGSRSTAPDRCRSAHRTGHTGARTAPLLSLRFAPWPRVRGRRESLRSPLPSSGAIQTLQLRVPSNPAPGTRSTRHADPPPAEPSGKGRRVRFLSIDPCPLVCNLTTSVNTRTSLLSRTGRRRSHIRPLIPGPKPPVHPPACNHYGK